MPDTADNGQQMDNRPTLETSKPHILELIRAGRYTEAQTILKSICDADPGNAEAYYMLGCNNVRLGLLDDAIVVLQQSIHTRPDIAQSHTALGGALRALGRNSEAAESFNAALELDSTLTDVHVVLAEIAITQEDFASAENHLHTVLKLDPRMSNAHITLGRLEKERGNHLKSLSHLEQALQINPRSVNALCITASELRNLSRDDEAEDCYRKALDIDPESVDALAGLALLYEHKGMHDKAIDLITPLLGKRPDHADLVQVYARLCKHTGTCREAIKIINEILQNPKIIRSTRMALHFTAGKILDDMKQYDEAFAHYKSGNDLVTHMYDAAGNAQLVNNLISTFTPAMFMRLPRATLDSQGLIFIVGMPRSGTSLTEQIVASHPEVYGAGELTDLTRTMQHFPYLVGCEKPFPACIDRIQKDLLDEIAGNYLSHVNKLAGGIEHITDKMPHNFYALGLIQLLFPQARVIHCHRDPFDTCLSIYFQNFLDEHDYAKDLFNIGIHYHQYQRLIQHWKQVLTIPILDVSYEDLVNNQKKVTREILEFCALDWDDACMEFHRLGRHVMTASYDQVRQPIYSRSIGRWRHYRQHLEPLKEGLRRCF